MKQIGTKAQVLCKQINTPRKMDKCEKSSCNTRKKEASTIRVDYSK